MLSHTPSFAEIAGEVLQQKALRSLETRKGAQQWIGRLVGHFGQERIDRITENSWTAYVLRERQRKPRKFFDDRKHMRTVLNYAHRQGFIVARVRLPIPDPPWDAGREVLGNELTKLEAAAGPELRFQIRIAWKMGLRLREMLCLRWDRFDCDLSVIELVGSDTKTRRGRRIPLPADLLPEFAARRARARSPYVFPSRCGKSWQKANKTAWRRCRLKAGVMVRWHDLRHTCATLLLRRGIPPHVARVYLGMSEAVLTRIYLHLSIEDLRVAAEAMNDKVGRTQRVGCRLRGVIGTKARTPS